MTQSNAIGASIDLEQRYDFRIREEALGAAIDAIVQQTDLIVLYPHELASEKGMASVIGEYTVPEAFRILFRETEFSGGLTENGVMYITRSGEKDSKTLEDRKVSQRTSAKGIWGLLSGVSTVVLGAVSGAPALAQDDGASASRDEIVVVGRSYRDPSDATATKLTTPISETPGSIAVLNEQILDDLAVVDFSEAIKYFPNASIFNNFGGGFQFESRGFRSSNRNDVRVNGSPTGSDFLFDNVAIDRVEFVKGASAVTYGQITPAGFVNIGLKQAPDEVEFTGQFRVGNFGLARGEIAVGGPLTADGSVRAMVGYAKERGGIPYELSDKDSDAFFATLAVDLSEAIRKIS